MASNLKQYNKQEVLDKLSNPKKKTKITMESNNRIFISHSSLDKEIVEQLINLLENIGVPSEKIFCSSFEGYGIKLGADFLHTIKEELNKDVLVLFVLSKNFYNSPVCLCEMGATWVKTNEHIPILIPPFEYSEIKGVIPNTQGMKINEKLKLNLLKDKIEDFLSISSQNHSSWERKRDFFLKTITNTLHSHPNTENVENEINSQSIQKDISNSIDALIKQKARTDWPDDFNMQVYVIESQRAAYQECLNHNPSDIPIHELNRIKAKAQRDWPDDFVMRLHVEQDQVANYRTLQNL
jgi:hypothetical protein